MSDILNKNNILDDTLKSYKDSTAMLAALCRCRNSIAELYANAKHAN